MRRVYKNMWSATISASIMAANMWICGKIVWRMKNLIRIKFYTRPYSIVFYRETVLTLWISLVIYILFQKLTWREICVFQFQKSNSYFTNIPYSSLAKTVLLTLILLKCRVWWAHNNASKWQMGFNSAFEMLNIFQVVATFENVITLCHRIIY